VHIASWLITCEQSLIIEATRWGIRTARLHKCICNICFLFFVFFFFIRCMHKACEHVLSCEFKDHIVAYMLDNSTMVKFN
jgi:hypothetical protein